MLTRKQLDCYNAIKAYKSRNFGVAPSYDELLDLLGLKSKSGVFRLVSALEERGAIKRIPNRARAIKLLPLDELTDNAQPSS